MRSAIMRYTKRAGQIAEGEFSEMSCALHANVTIDAAINGIKASNPLYCGNCNGGNCNVIREAGGRN